MTSLPLRLPEELKAGGSAQAARAGGSLNRYIATLLAAHVGARAGGGTLFHGPHGSGEAGNGAGHPLRCRQAEAATGGRSIERGLRPVSLRLSIGLIAASHASTRSHVQPGTSALRMIRSSEFSPRISRSFRRCHQASYSLRFSVCIARVSSSPGKARSSTAMSRAI